MTYLCQHQFCREERQQGRQGYKSANARSKHEAKIEPHLCSAATGCSVCAQYEKNQIKRKRTGTRPEQGTLFFCRHEGCCYFAVKRTLERHEQTDHNCMESCLRCTKLDQTRKRKKENEVRKEHEHRCQEERKRLRIDQALQARDRVAALKWEEIALHNVDTPNDTFIGEQVSICILFICFIFFIIIDY